MEPKAKRVQIGHYALYKKPWRLRNPEKRYAEKSRYYAQFTNARNRRAQWTVADCTAIIAENHPCDRILSHILGRSVVAIQTKRWQLQK